jgi:PAS domain S-box-containing protein
LSLLGCTLIPAFFLIDLLLLSEHEVLVRLAFYRGAAAGLLLAQLFVTARGALGSAGRWNFLYGYFTCLVACGMVTLACRELGGFRSSYYAGLNLVLIGVNTFLPWPLRHAIVSSALVVLMYLAGNATIEPFDGTALLHNLWFIGGTLIIVISAAYARNDLVRREFALRAELGASEARFRSVATSAPDGIVVIDEHGHVVFWNEGAERVFGRAAGEIMGRPLSLVLPPRHRAGHEAGLARLRAGGTARVLGQTAELVGMNALGEELPCEVSITSWTSGGARFYSAVIRDISGRKRDEERLRAFAADLERVNAELTAYRRVLDDDLHQAREFQLALLGAPARAEGVHAEIVYRPAESVGGDLYDVHALPEGGLRVLLADTTGHGVQAALRAIMVKALYERHKTRWRDPGQVLAALSDEIVALPGGRELILTACCLDVTPAGPGGVARLRFASAGHPPLVRVAGGGATELFAAGPLVGLVAGVRYTCQELELAAGERIFALTDGVIEQFDATGGRLPDSVVHQALAQPGPLPEVLEGLLARLEVFRGRPELDDDVAIVGIEIPGTPSG